MSAAAPVAGLPSRDTPRRTRLHLALPVLGALLLTALYLWRYAADPAVPGGSAQFPEGWWGWWDQGHYLRSATALARGNFDPAQHWYPLGYAAVAAPFVWLSRDHAFFAVDLLSLLGCYAGFLAFARRLGIPAAWGSLVFVASVASSRLIFAQWVLPWNTSPVAALLWLLLAMIAAHFGQGGIRGGAHGGGMRRRPLLIGFLAAAIPLFRPTEALLSALCLLAVVLHDLFGTGRRPWTERGRDLLRLVLWLVLGGLLAVVPYALLHARIYGLAPSDYMLHSQGLGFTVQGLGWKAYTLLVDPRPWFGEGEGLMRQAPYMALALGGLAVAWRHGAAARLLGLLLVAHSLLYLSYVDLLPVGLWRFNNVHYWKWAMPGFGLMAFLLLRDLLLWRRAPAFPLAPLALLASLPVLCLQLVPVEVPATAPARMLRYEGPAPGFDASYFGDAILLDEGRRLRNVHDIRLIPIPGGIRVFALRQPFLGTLDWAVPPPGEAALSPPRRYAARWRLGQPCWMPRVFCSREHNDLLPPVPRR
ncbi:hypothetical protein MVG78_02805 [Roseomonas gilardii subsp. gilardii]|uniref:hypothetical protein n=1 Tax=Roseomonas gilardii TaxID=257708 RepID=UPI001FF8E2D9|nr:hypothetical protein [Roseomonas gilardii]UPG73126.1 hypothetical protein MVG78_02805 [Roseomonas gilardii subsp. gilardii]